LDRSKKEQIVDELQEKLKDVKMAVLADYSGMNVSKITSLRTMLRSADAELRVVKNTLLRLASRETDFALFDDHLKGPIALIMNFGDIVQPTKALVDFAKKEDKLELRVGMLDGKILSIEQIKAISELPGREVLLGKFLSVLVGAQTQLVSVLSAVPRQFVQVLDAYRLKKEEAN